MMMMMMLFRKQNENPHVRRRFSLGPVQGSNSRVIFTEKQGPTFRFQLFERSKCLAALATTRHIICNGEGKQQHGKKKKDRIEEDREQKQPSSHFLQEKGMLKKAQELSVLCDAEVAAVIFSATGKLYQSCTARSLPEMLERYRYCVGSSVINQNPSEEENCHSRLASIQKCAELLQILDRDLEESHIDNLSVTDLVQLEKQLDDALTETTSRKTQMLLQSISALREKIAAVLEYGHALEEEMNSNKNELGQQPGSSQQQQRQPAAATLNFLR